MSIVGLDIGGANIKAATPDGIAVSAPFEIWKSPDSLAAAIEGLLSKLHPATHLAVTMTAELADCFRTKAEGVDAVLQSVLKTASGRPVGVWQTSSEFVSPDVAREFPQLTAAANWHALATWAGRMVPSSTGLLIDIGSTTTDIIPLRQGLAASTGLTDLERLRSGELVYSGATRTPVCAIAHSVPFRGDYCSLAAEWFATTLDVYLLTGRIDDDPSNTDTANGRPATSAEAHDRLARALCCDRTEIELSEAVRIAEFLADVQQQRISGAMKRVLTSCSSESDDARVSRVLVSGSGSFLGDEIVARTIDAETDVTRLADMKGSDVASAACAYAVACLAAERLGC